MDHDPVYRSQVQHYQQWISVRHGFVTARSTARLPIITFVVCTNYRNLSKCDKGDPRIEGIAISGTTETSKVSAYADDATLMLKGVRSVARAFEVIECYEKASGGKLNWEKTEGIYVGKQVGRTSGPVPIKWREDAITVLGTKIGNDLRQDWDKQLDKLQKNCDAWKNRNITMIGKAVLIRTYGIASITYLASLFPVPQQVLIQAQRICFKFLWSNKNELVAWATCHLPRIAGGSEYT